MWILLLVAVLGLEVGFGLFFFSLIWASHQAAEWEERDLSGAMPGAAACTSLVPEVLIPLAEPLRHD